MQKNMSMKKRLRRATIASCFALLGGLGASAVEGATCPAGSTPQQCKAVSSCTESDEDGQLIIVTSDLALPAGLTECIKVRDDNVTVDCDGHHITGAAQPNTRAIYVRRSGSNRVSNVEIRNCNISDLPETGPTELTFDKGIRLDRVDGAILTNNVSSNNVNWGIRASDSTAITVTGSTANNNGDSSESDQGGIKFARSAGTIDANTVSGNATYGILVTGDPEQQVTLQVTNNTAEQNLKGIQLEGILGGSDEEVLLEGNVASNNPNQPSLCTGGPGCDEGYGIDLRKGSRRIVIRGNTVVNNGDEGIHMSGKDDSLGCLNLNGPDPDEGDAGQNIIDSNTATGNGEEGIYILCSDNNRITNNAMIDNNVANNGTAGIFLDEHSTRNWIEGNELLNDTIELRNESSHNVLIDNELDDDNGSLVTLRFNGSSHNFVKSMDVDPRGDSVPYTLLEYQNAEQPADPLKHSTCNQILDSSASRADEHDIAATGASTNNRFLRLDPSDTEVSCSIGPSASVQVTDVAGTEAPCGTNGIDPNACVNYWFATNLCNKGGPLVEATTQTLSGDQIGIGVNEEVRYHRARGAPGVEGVLTTGSDGTNNFTVGPKGCVHLAATDRVELGPGTVVEAGGRLSVGF